jgi:hypothetical protein
MRYTRLAAVITSVGLFAHWFSPSRPQWLVEGLWLAALCLWVVEVKRVTRGSLFGSRVNPLNLLPLIAVTALFVAAWLPFYDNWRWAYTGDSISWFEVGRAPAAQHQLPQSILSLNGVDGNFTYLHGIGFNSLMFIFGPTFFWHRVGKLIFSCLSLAAIYAFFTVTLGRWWATAIVVGTATNYVWLWFSYVSYAHIDSFIFYYLSLTLAVLILRKPDRLGLWLLCGMLGGLSLYFTQTAWSAVVAVGIVIGVFALLTRRFAGLATYLLSFLLMSVPVILQIPFLIEMTTRQAKSIFEWDYLLRIFTEIVILAYGWNYVQIGIQGAFLRWPLGPLYVVGVLLAALGVVPALRRSLHLPAIAPVMLGLFLWDAVLMTLTNNGYGQPSSKRVYQLIPLQVFFGLLPLYAIYARCAGRRWLRLTTISLVALTMVVYAAANLQLISSPLKGVYGVNIFDGLIELRQRFSDRRVVVFSSRSVLTNDLVAPSSFFNQTYHLRDTVALERSFEPHTLETACASRPVVCYEPSFDGESFQRMSALMRDRLQPFELLNTQEMQCFECAAVAVTLGHRLHTRAAG